MKGRQRFAPHEAPVGFIGVRQCTFGSDVDESSQRAILLADTAQIVLGQLPRTEFTVPESVPLLERGHFGK